MLANLWQSKLRRYFWHCFGLKWCYNRTIMIFLSNSVVYQFIPNKVNPYKINLSIFLSYAKLIILTCCYCLQNLPQIYHYQKPTFYCLRSSSFFHFQSNYKTSLIKNGNKKYDQWNFKQKVKKLIDHIREEKKLIDWFTKLFSMISNELCPFSKYFIFTLIRAKLLLN